MSELSTESNKVLNIFHLDDQKTFEESDALLLIDTLHLVTSKAKNKIGALSGQAQFHKRNPNEAQIYQQRMNEEIQRWSEKVRRLGAIPLSLYKVKIAASRGGHYTWEFPSSSLTWD